jgi:L-threonylcarbamoyladenylate synthase
VFGLLADAQNPEAIERVIALKGRDPKQPIALLLPNVAALDLVASTVPQRARRLAERHWPGPLTLVVPARSGLPSPLTRDGKVGVRVPGQSPALQLVQAFAAPLTATSANLTGQPAARTYGQALAAFPSGLAAIVAAPAPGGPVSTVIDITGPNPVILRAGAVILDPKDETPS